MYSTDYGSTDGNDNLAWVTTTTTAEGYIYINPPHPMDNIELNIVIGEDGEGGRLRPPIDLGDALDRLED